MNVLQLILIVPSCSSHKRRLESAVGGSPMWILVFVKDDLLVFR